MSDKFKEGYKLVVTVIDRNTGDILTLERTSTSPTWHPLLHNFVDALSGVGFIGVKERVAVKDHDGDWVPLTYHGYYD